MQTGEYIRDRLLPEAIRTACKRQAVQLTTYSDEWVLRLQKNGKSVWFFGYKCDGNRAAASHIAQDKVATYEILQAAGVPAVRHLLVRSVANEPVQTEKLSTQFANLAVVIKPLNGTGGRGVDYYTDVHEALEFIQTSSEPAWAISPYLNIVAETRLIVIDSHVVLAYEKLQPQTEHGITFYNLSHGAQAVDIADGEIPEHSRDLALQACQELGLHMAAVDIVQTNAGEQMVLEVNDGFSMEYYARQSAEHKKRAIKLYDIIVENLFS